MDDSIGENRPKFEYPKNNLENNKFLYKYNNKASKLNANPLINHFTIESFFIFDQYDNIKYFESLSDKNNIKLYSNEVNFLNNVFNEIKIIKNVKKGDEIISLDSKIYEKITSYFKVEKQRPALSEFLEKKY